MTLDVQCPAVYPDGYKMVFVGDAPGKEDCDAREGFTGSDGRALQKACKVAGIPWEQVGRTNLAKRRPQVDSNDFRLAFYETIEEPIYTPTGKLSKRTSKTTLWTAECQEWNDQLARELRDANPNLVVAAGHEAISAITAFSGVPNYRGSVVESRGAFTRPDGNPCKVLCIEHPRYIVRGSVADFWLLANDLKKAKREAEFADIRREPLNTLVRPRFEEVIGRLRDIEELGLPWTLDFETRAGTPACFAVAMRYPDGIYSVCVPLQTPSGPYWSGENECAIWEALNNACACNNRLCNQNIEYDIYYLLRYGIEPSGVWMDTMLAHALLYPEWPKSLAFLCSFYLDDVVYYKGEGRDWSDGDRDEQLWEYCCKDAIYTLRIVEIIDRQLKERGMYEFYHGQS
jgi:uracil-DNA glycosylase